jgi:hypothetical protein
LQVFGASCAPYEGHVAAICVHYDYIVIDILSSLAALLLMTANRALQVFDGGLPAVPLEWNPQLTSVYIMTI